MEQVSEKLDWSVERIKSEAAIRKEKRKPGKELKTLEILDMYAEQGDGPQVYVVIKYHVEGRDRIMTRIVSLWSEEGELLVTRFEIGRTYAVQMTRLFNGYWSWTNVMEWV